jgi:hypothetical protein
MPRASNPNAPIQVTVTIHPSRLDELRVMEKLLKGPASVEPPGMTVSIPYLEEWAKHLEQSSIAFLLKVGNHIQAFAFVAKAQRKTSQHDIAHMLKTLAQKTDREIASGRLDPEDQVAVTEVNSRLVELLTGH